MEARRSSHPEDLGEQIACSCWMLLTMCPYQMATWHTWHWGCMSPDTSQFCILDGIPPDLKREAVIRLLHRTNTSIMLQKQVINHNKSNNTNPTVKYHIFATLADYLPTNIYVRLCECASFEHEAWNLSNIGQPSSAIRNCSHCNHVAGAAASIHGTQCGTSCRLPQNCCV